jgi:hypothetical protein
MDCGISNQYLSNKVPSQFTFTGPSNIFLKIPAASSYNLQFQITNGIASAYIQFKEFDGELAGYLNTAVNSANGR